MTSTRDFLAALSHDERPRLSPLTVGGKFNLRAIMRSAIGTARMVLGPKVTRSRTMTWRIAMKIGLASAWKAAKAELARIAQDAAFYANARALRSPAPVRVTRSVAGCFPVRTYDRGSRVHSHGW